MPNDENTNPSVDPPNAGKRSRDALRLGPRKKSRTTDPLVHHGRHFARTIHALCNIQALITEGLIRMGDRADDPDEAFTPQERRQHKVFRSLLNIVPGLEERLLTAASEHEIQDIAALLQKGASSARSDDTKSLKSAIIDWLVPPGELLIPPIPRSVKDVRGFKHEVTGSLLCPAGLDWSDEGTKSKLVSGELTVPGDQWPIFLYASHTFDEEDPWKGLLQSSLLVKASKTFKHIFTSPSSVEKEAKATRSGNARIHRMTRVTRASIAYAATQARFALSSSSVFTRNDTVTDSERFYNTIHEFLEDPEETKEVDRLLAWWNRKVFPNYIPNSRPISQNSALAKIKAKREVEKRAALENANSN